MRKYSKIRQVYFRPNAADIVRHFQHYNEVTGRRFESSCELFNTSAEIYNKCTLEIYEKFGYIFQAGVFEVFIAIKSVIYLNQVNAIKIYIKENSFCFV